MNKWPPTTQKGTSSFLKLRIRKGKRITGNRSEIALDLFEDES